MSKKRHDFDPIDTPDPKPDPRMMTWAVFAFFGTGVFGVLFLVGNLHINLFVSLLIVGATLAALFAVAAKSLGGAKKSN